jgi:aminocarboxymuconate-semialdehyde decarboxylase
MFEFSRVDRLLDCHFHWYPREIENGLNAINGNTRLHGAEWYDLDGQLERMDALGGRVDVISSTGPFTGLFTATDAENSRRLTRSYNETMAEGQRKHGGRVWGTCVLPLLDTDSALAELDYAITELGLVGVNIPGRIGQSDNLDDPRLEPVYDRIVELGVPVLIHPNDEAFESALAGYNGALHLSLGRVIDVSVSAYRLVLSGIIERHGAMRIMVTHTGGALPYQAGRMDKNSGAAGLPKAPTHYIKSMYTDTVSPHAAGVRFALDFYGADHVMYGSDYPCWDPVAALRILSEIELDDVTFRKVAYQNAYEFFGLDRQSNPAPPSTGASPEVLSARA